MVRAGLATVALAMVLSGAALAQFQPVPTPPYYAINPATTLNPRADSPAQQQVLQNYRTQLQQTQHDLLQQSPSGLDRDQLEIGRQLNAVAPSAILPQSAPAIPSVPFPSVAAPGAVPLR